MAVEAEERFWTKVNKRGPLILKSRCWVWTGCRGLDGYGRLIINGRLTLAHRFSYQLKTGPIQNGLCILHKCDNPPCVRISHLVGGTQGDNVRDCFRKKRHRFGDGHRNAKLTDKQALDIRSRIPCLGIGARLAKEFSVSRATISRIRNGKRWKHI